MKKLLFTALSVVVALSTTAGAAFADDAKQMAGNTLMLPVKALAVGSGMAVGVPLACMKRMAYRSINITNEFADNIGGHENFPPVAFASVLGVPFGMVSGGAEGVYLGAKNAIHYGAEKPFSKESFSMGDIDED